MNRDFFVKGYKLTRKLEHSGFRTLYRGVQMKSGEEVFLVVIQVRPGRAMEAMKKRAQDSQKLVHPRLISALDFGILPKGGFFFSYSVRSLVPIKEVVNDIESDEERWFAIARYFIEALETLEYIHNANTTHRDLSTAQLRVDEKQRVYLDGFINARPRVESRNIAGMVDLPYMALELLVGSGTADRKTDIYSMGVIFYELITGHLPFSSNYVKIEEGKQGHVPSLTLHKMAVPEEMEEMITRTLGPRNARYSDVRLWIEELESFYQTRSIGQKVKDFSSTVKNLFSV